MLTILTVCRHPRGRPGRLERLEGAAPAHALLGNRAGARPAASPRSTARGASPRRRPSSRGNCRDWPDREFDAYVARHYPAYWLKVDLPHKIAHAQLRANMTEVEMPALVDRRRLRRRRAASPSLRCSRPTIRGCLSIIAGACAASPAPISSTRRSTRRPTAWRSTPSPCRASSSATRTKLRRAERIAPAIEKALRGEIGLPERGGAKRAAPKGAPEGLPIEPEVTINNQWSHRYTVVEVSGARPAGPALRADPCAVQAQPQYRLGACRDLRREGRRRFLRHGFGRREDHRSSPYRSHQAAAVACPQ